jgi:class 3 adenylate cyclase
LNALSADAVLEQLDQKGAAILHLLTMCRTPDYQHVWTQGPKLPRRFARLLLKQGHPTLALEVASRCLSAYVGDHELAYCRALALANSGNPTRAEAFVRELLADDGLPANIRSDSLALLGRVHKDLAARSTAARDEHLRQSFLAYSDAFGVTGDSFPAINAAALARLRGDREQSLSLADEARKKVLADFAKPGSERDYWLPATLAEAYLLLGDGQKAAIQYGKAVRLAREGNNLGDIASMLRQLRLYVRHLPPSELPITDELLALFHLGPVVVFVGQAHCFPPGQQVEDGVRDAIRRELDELKPTIGFCMPGSGGEIIFGELMRERGAELHVVLPFAENDFLAERVTCGLPGLQEWQTRYEALRGVLRVTQHFATTEEYLGDEVLYDFAARFMQGLALIRAAQVGAEAVLVAMHDGLRGWAGSTRRIELSGLTAPAQPAPAPRPRPGLPPRTVKAMLFADVAGFTGLPEAHLPAFFIDFLSVVERELQATPALARNTWGDGLYLVFENAPTCAGFALGLLERMEKFDFPSHGFALTPDSRPGVRIGLHTGPVFEGHDAIINRNNYFGRHVSRAARIEPVAAPGCAFASEQFAAALAASPGHGFVCEYIGMQPLPKDFDVVPLYRLARRM